MMPSPNRIRYAVMAVLVLVLVLGAILITLYLRTREQDSSLYFEKLALIRQIKQVDAHWELDVMRSRMGINENYDPLVGPQVELDRLNDRLMVMISGQPSAALADAGRAIRDALHDKAQLIERFKSHNAVLRNSLVFLPTAAFDLSTALGDTRTSAAAEDFLAASNQVLLDTMVFSQRPSAEAADLIARHLQGLTLAERMKIPAVSAAFAVFRLHVLTVLREQPTVTRILTAIALVPTIRRINAFDALLNGGQNRIEQQTRRDRQFLLLFAAALATMFVYVAIRLIASHALVYRVNRELSDANISLEQRVLERTHAVSASNYDLRTSQAQLVALAVELAAARDAAESNDRAKSAFLATMSHELRTPLNAIIGFAELMQRTLFGPLGHEKYAEYIDDIHKSGSHLLSLINDILDLSRLDAGKADLDERDFALDMLIGDVCRSLQPLARRGRLELGAVLPPGLPLLHGDPRRIRQIILNLLSNAIKFTPDGGTVCLSAEICADGLRLIVRDTGIGMSAEEIPKAMERFGQVDSRLARKYEGTGLGLPLAKQLVELHDGRFEIESAPDIGTTVRITFPPERLMPRQNSATGDGDWPAVRMG